MNKKAQQLSTLFFVLFVLVLIVLIVSGILVSYRNTLPHVSIITNTSNFFNSKPLNVIQVKGYPLYPDNNLTPGDVLTEDASVVCVPGYTKEVRYVPESERKQVFESYHIMYPPLYSGAYELDHFIPLELGGSNEKANLWPEAADPVPGFHEKDKVENYLHKLVCNYNISLKDAQILMANDWVAVYHQCCEKV